MIRSEETYDNLTAEIKYTHDDYGRLKTREYPSGLKVSHKYNVHGYLKTISTGNKTLWECLEMNPLGKNQCNNELAENKQYPAGSVHGRT